MATFPNGYEYRKKISVDSTKVSGSHTDFPMLVSLTDADLKSTTNGGKLYLPSGYPDIRFENPTGTKLDYELEEYVSSTGQVIAWVRIPSLTTTTAIYMYYGNNSLTASEQNKSGVWGANDIVHHMNVTSGAPSAGSLTPIYNGLTTRAGKIGTALDFNDASGDYLNLGNYNFTGNTQRTFSAWVYADTFTEDMAIIARNSISTASQFLLWYDVSTASATSNAFTFLIGGATANTRVDIPSNTATTGAWYYVVGTYQGNSTTGLRLYINGVQRGNSISTTGTGLTSLQSSSQNIIVGSNNGATTRGMDGIIEEVRIRAANLSADWIATEYNNQNDPSTFYAVGGEETVQWLADFESGMPSEIINTGNLPWVIDSTTSSTGTSSAKSGAIADSQYSGMKLHFENTADTVFQFDYKVDSEPDYDEFEVYIDGIFRMGDNGNSSNGGEFWAHGSQTGPEYSFTPGQHTIEFRYVKDASASTGADAAWVDNIVLISAEPISFIVPKNGGAFLPFFM